MFDFFSQMNNEETTFEIHWEITDTQASSRHEDDFLLLVNRRVSRDIFALERVDDEHSAHLADVLSDDLGTFRTGIDAPPDFLAIIHEGSRDIAKNTSPKGHFHRGQLFQSVEEEFQESEPRLQCMAILHSQSIVQIGEECNRHRVKIDGCRLVVRQIR